MRRNLTLEEKMDLAGTDDMRKAMMGLSLRKGLRKLGRGVRKVGRAVAKAPGGLVRKFNPNRDAGKAKMVKALNAKLVKEHANFLHMKDLRRGVKRPHGIYVAASKPWAKAQISKAGLPTSFSGVAGGDDLLGAVFIGTWWNPASWFKRKAKYVLVNTEGQRLAEMSASEYEAFKGSQEAMALRDQAQQEAEGAPTPEEAARQLEEEAGPSPEMPPEMPAVDEEAGEEIMTMGKLYRSIKDPFEGIDGWAEEQLYNPEELAFILGAGSWANEQMYNPEELAFILGDEGTEFQQMAYPEEAAMVFGDDAPAFANMDHLAFVWGSNPSHGERYDRAIEAAGDDRIGRLARRQMRNSAVVGRARRKRGGGSRERDIQRASALEQMIARQMASKVVSRKLVCHWACKAARAMGKGKDEAKRLARWKKKQIEAAGAVLSKTKSETAGCF